MSYNKNILPIGVHDYLPEECYNKNILEIKISEVFLKSGFKKIEPPTFEYIDTYNFDNSSHMEKVFKLIDFDGKVLALRADPTLQISRIAATKLNDNVNRLFYVLNSYEFTNNQTQNSRTREFSQVGLELIGLKGSQSDAEVLVMAIQSLLECGLKDFKIDIGQVDYFLGIINSYGLDFKVIETIRERINNKDLEGIRYLLKKENLTAEVTEVLLSIPGLFGGKEVLEKAQKLAQNDQSKNAVKNIKEILDLLEQYGYSNYVSIDFGMLPHLSYYSGIIFRGMTNCVGAAILEGGRYDNLSTYFGANNPSVGFSIGIKRLMEAVKKTNGLMTLKASNYAYCVLDNAEKKAFEYINKLRNQGLYIERAYVNNEQDLIEYCRSKNIKKYLVISDQAIKEGSYE
ncbi:MAG TPA: ATP phosphoribosyltransferase regulatory subunit [Clostridia bacterium]